MFKVRRSLDRFFQSNKLLEFKVLVNHVTSKLTALGVFRSTVVSDKSLKGQFGIRTGVNRLASRHLGPQLQLLAMIHNM